MRFKPATNLVSELKSNAATDGVAGERSDDSLLSARLQCWYGRNTQVRQERAVCVEKVSGRTSGGGEASGGDNGDTKGEDGEAHLG